ncbi:hypothetical protein KR044_010414 [Drosophila immigrans]|nr:hypothetical protein KR044_010414 [Drosophila immigrans]
MRMNACCFCMSLRRGCIGIAFFDIIVNLVIIIFGPDDIVSQPERAVCICHCIGCVMLLLGAVIQSTVLLIFYLITSFVNSSILVICFVIVTIHIMSIRYSVLSFVLVLTGEFQMQSHGLSVSSLSITGINIYFYIVAYSYYQQVNTPFEEDDEA